MTARVLVIDDDPGMLRYMKTLLQMESCEVQTANGGLNAIALIENGLSPDVVFLDLMMPGMDGLNTLQRIREINPRLKIVMLSCLKDTAKVVEAMRQGAEDFLNKPLDGAAVEKVLQRCLSPEANKPVPSIVPENAEELPGGLHFVAGSETTRKVRDQIGQMAPFDIPVLFLGESGVGKEVAALLLHKLSPRSKQTFLKVNCAAIPSELLESELFGYEAGAFTGAVQAKPGKFEACNGGTILLDEIGELPPALQAKLLQVLQEQRFFRLGGRTPISIDVRILAATNIDIEDAIKKGKFRLDLYYRLNTFAIQIPPLRQRRDDIPILIEHFNHQFSSYYARPLRVMTPETMNACLNHRWPGNIRELHNFVKRFVVLGDEASMLKEIRKASDKGAPLVAFGCERKDLKQLVRDLKQNAEAKVIAQALEETNWRRRDAAALLNISYKALVYKARQYGLENPPHTATKAGVQEVELAEEAATA